MLQLSNRPTVHSLETQRALFAADGYLFLNLPEEALAEVESIHESDQGDPVVLLVKIRTLLHLRNWSSAETLAHSAEEKHPEEGEFTVQRAFALHQMQKGDEAVEVLLAAPEWIRRTGILHYNLACYEARFGDLTVARQCINTAIQINAAMKRNARTDPDLAALWN